MPNVVFSLAATLLLISPLSNAQEFTLFGEFERSNEDQNEQTRTDNLQGTSSSSDSSMFQLIGLTKIGATQRALLLHSNGEVIRASLEGETANVIPGYEDHHISISDSRNIEIQFPEDTPCVQSPDKGVVCNPRSNSARLSLVLRDTIVANDSEAPDNENDNPVEAPDNPFARIRAANAADNPASDPNPQRFRPRRIAPEDVPEGMRVISTPFGDRLVQE